MSFHELIKNILVTPIGMKRLDKIIPNYFRFFNDMRRFNRFSTINRAKFRNIYPQLWDATKTTPFDAHYLYQALWASGKIYTINPKYNVDIGSQIQFASTLGINIPTIYMDFRPVNIKAKNFLSTAGDIMHLPFQNNSIESLSCLHVIEHIGLGRYGDKLDPQGHLEGINEIKRVIANNGNLIISTPVGQERICFNAHRIFNPIEFLSYFQEFQMLEFSFVDDQDNFHEKANLQDAAKQRYACGMFWLRKYSKTN